MESKAPLLIVNDGLLPSQRWPEVRALRPEQRLMLAVLEDGFNAIQKNLFAQRPKGKAAFSSAMDWLMSEGEKWPFSFRNVCASLGLEAEYIRDGIIKWCNSARERAMATSAEPEQSQP